MFVLASCRLEITSVNDTPLAIFGIDEDAVVLEMDSPPPQCTSYPYPQKKGIFYDCYH